MDVLNLLSARSKEINFRVALWFYGWRRYQTFLNFRNFPFFEFRFRKFYFNNVNITNSPRSGGRKSSRCDVKTKLYGIRPGKRKKKKKKPAYLPGEVNIRPRYYIYTRSRFWQISLLLLLLLRERTRETKTRRGGGGERRTEKTQQIIYLWLEMNIPSSSFVAVVVIVPKFPP